MNSTLLYPTTIILLPCALLGRQLSIFFLEYRRRVRAKMFVLSTQQRPLTKSSSIHCISRNYPRSPRLDNLSQVAPDDVLAYPRVRVTRCHPSPLFEKRPGEDPAYAPLR